MENSRQVMLNTMQGNLSVKPCNFSLKLQSVQVSFQNLTLAFVTSGIGVLMALYVSKWTPNL
jgi:hypothetical protein